jgi:protoporphyrinogen oxidase
MRIDATPASSINPESPPSVVVLGAGPAGLGAAFRLSTRNRFTIHVIERNPEIGGNAGSFEIDGLRVDYGSHRLHPSCPEPILADIRHMLGADLLDRPRHGRIRLRGRWVHFPLKPFDLCRHLPPDFMLGVGLDSVGKIVRPRSTEDNFESILRRGLGETICRDFYFPYARKIWGVEPAALDATQARRRVSAGSLGKMARKVLSAVPGLKPKGSGRFYYPRHGFGSISEAYCKVATSSGVSLRRQTALTAVEIADGRACAVHLHSERGPERLPATQVLSTIPITTLARAITPQAPQSVLEAACALRFRSMILIYVVLETDRFTEFDAHYFPDPEIPLTRLSEPKNYGLSSLPGKTVLCAELPCAKTDHFWGASDRDLGILVTDALSTAGIPVRAAVKRVVTRRLEQAYPIYTRDYREHFDHIDGWLNGIDGIVTFGRQGLFAHDNTHHALAMAYALDECLDAGGALNRKLWDSHRASFEKHVVED